MNRSTSAVWRRIRSSDCVRYGSDNPSRNRSSPCIVTTTGRFSVRRIGPGHRDQQRVRDVDDVRRRLPLQPLDQLVELLLLMAVFALEHRDRHLAQHPRVGLHRPAGEGLDDRRRVPQPVEQPRRVAQKRDVLVEVDADAAEQHRVAAADVGLVGQRGRVDGHQRDVVPPAQQLRRQRVVAQARAAVHVRGPGGDRQNLHRCRMTYANHRDTDTERTENCIGGLEHVAFPKIDLRASFVFSVSPWLTYVIDLTRRVGSRGGRTGDRTDSPRAAGPSRSGWSGSGPGSGGPRAANARGGPAGPRCR